MTHLSRHVITALGLSTCYVIAQYYLPYGDHEVMSSNCKYNLGCLNQPPGSDITFFSPLLMMLQVSCNVRLKELIKVYLLKLSKFWGDEKYLSVNTFYPICNNQLILQTFLLNFYPPSLLMKLVKHQLTRSIRNRYYTFKNRKQYCLICRLSDIRIHCLPSLQTFNGYQIIYKIINEPRDLRGKLGECDCSVSLPLREKECMIRVPKSTGATINTANVCK